MRVLECEKCATEFSNASINGVECPKCGCKRVLEVMSYEDS